MNYIDSLLELLEKNNIKIGLANGKLKVIDENKNLTESILSSIRENKERLISLLSNNAYFSKSDFPYSSLRDEKVQILQKFHPNLENLYIATPLQSGLLFHGMEDGVGASYSTQMFCELLGDIDVEKLMLSWEAIVERHDILRTCFTGFDESQIHQVVLSDIEIPFNVEDWSKKDAIQQERDLFDLREKDKEKGFDFEKAPLYRFNLIKLDSNRYHFVWTNHHALLDGWCKSILFSEVVFCYKNLVSNTPHLMAPVEPYHKYIQWLHSRDINNAKTFWSEYLKEALWQTTLPFDQRQSANTQSLAENAVKVLSISNTVTNSLVEKVKKAKCTMNVLVQAAWAYLLHRYSGEKCVVFGCVESGRPAEIAGVDKMVGLFVNTVPLCVTFDHESRLDDVLSSMHRDSVLRSEYSYLSLTEIQKCSAIKNGVSLFDSLLGYENYPVEEIFKGETDVEHNFSVRSVGQEEWSNYGLDLSIQHNANLTITLKYKKNRFSSSDASKVINHLARLLDIFSTCKLDLLLDDIELVTENEKNILLKDFNNTHVPFPAEKTVHGLFAECAQHHSHNLALSFAGKELSYKELDEQSWQLSVLLSRQGVKPGSIVGIQLENGYTFGLAMLSVLKLGACFVPLDPQYPRERLDYMVSDSGAACVIVENAFAMYPQVSGVKVIPFDSLEIIKKIPLRPEVVAINSLAPACVFYTSGSTGKPKGVVISHANIVNYALAMIRKLSCHSDDRVLQMSSFSFDVVLEEYFPAWLSGGAVIVRDGLGLLGAEELQALLIDKSISYFEASFAQWREWLYWLEANGCKPGASLRRVMVGCDTIPPHLMEQWLCYDIPLLHVFGLTETTVTSSVLDSRDWDRDSSRHVPVGRPIDNTSFYVLSPRQQLQPIGVAGELYIGGAGVASGYLHRPDLTSERFVKNPFVSGDEKLYRTGDMARWLEDGNLEFLGRRDDQVKIRGYRIELGELESHLLSLPEVKEASVVAWSENRGDDKQLVAYVVESDLDQPASKKVRFYPPSGDHFMFDSAHYVKMMNDVARNRCYTAVINNAVKDKVVLEIGPGAELVLTQMCLSAGARKIYSVEKCEQAYLKAKDKLATLEGGDRVTLILGEFPGVNIAEPIDCCVSELIGTIGSSEGAGPILDSVLAMQEKAIQIIPGRCVTKIAAVELTEDECEISFNETAQYYSQKIFSAVGNQFDLRVCATNIANSHVISTADIFEDLNFSERYSLEKKEDIHIHITRDAKITGFIAWINLFVDEDHVVDVFSDKTSSFSPTYFPISLEGIAVGINDEIRGSVYREHNASGQGVDYFIDAKLYRLDGSVEDISFKSWHRTDIFNSNSFYVRLNESLIAGREEQQVKTEPFEQKLRALLKQSIPGYIIPSRIIVLDRLPLTLSGKIDKKALPAPHSYLNNQLDYVAPESEQEKLLCGIWSKALGLESVGTHDNFFEIGGDSIISIQVASRATQAGIPLSVRKIFEHQTISQIIKHIDKEHIIDAPQHEIAGEQKLLPIHYWFFEEKILEQDANVLSLFLIPPADISQEFIGRWVDSIYRRHDALRLRFTNANGNRHADYRPLDSGLLDSAVVRIDVSEMDSQCRTTLFSEAGHRLQTSLSLEKGELFRVGFFECDRGDHRLLIVIHHAVVDGVSWRIILDDLQLAHEQFKQGRAITLDKKTSSYQAWGEFLSNYSRSEEFQAEARYWEENLARAVNPLPRDERHEASLDDHDVIEISLDESSTSALLHECGSAYRTQINELLLAGIWLGVHRWTNQPSVRVWMEGHGRETLTERLDLTQTVGWFTTLFPLTLHAEEASYETVIKSIKEQHRRLPNKGMGYGVMRYLSATPAAGNDEAIEIMFNYLGQLDHTIKAETGFGVAPEYSGQSNGKENGRESLLGITGSVSNRKLSIAIDFSKGDFREETINRLSMYIKDELLGLIGHCTSEGVGSYTPSDFPLAHVSQGQLDSWQEQYKGIEAIYDAVPMQQGMIFHSLLDENSAAYLAQLAYKLSGPIDTGLYRTAWMRLIERHAIFRTVFVAMETDHIQQLVQASEDIQWQEDDISNIDQDAQREVIEHFSIQDRKNGIKFDGTPLMRVHIFKLGESSYQVLWSYFMGLFDGWSLPRINKELFVIYTALIESKPIGLSRPPLFQKYIEWRSKQNLAKSNAFWKEHLEGISSPTSLVLEKYYRDDQPPVLKTHRLILAADICQQLKNVAAKCQSTVNAILQLSWAYLLHRYTGENDVVFGTTLSGRPAEISNIEDMLGIFINTVPVRIKIDLESTIAKSLCLLNGDNLKRIEYGHLSLAEIQKLSELKQGDSLFDSILVFQNYPVEESVKEIKNNSSGVTIENVQSNEAFSFKLTIVAELQDKLHVEFKYSTEDFPEKSIAYLAAHFEHIVMQIGKISENEKISEIEILSERDKNELIGFGDGEHLDIEPGHTIVHQFQDMVSRYPQKIAAIFAGKRLTYEELNEKANQFAHYLVDRGAIQNDVVVLCFERSLDMLIAVLGVLKSGCAYLPVDSSYPLRRIEFIFNESNANFIITETNLQKLIPSTYKHEVIVVDEPNIKAAISTFPVANCDTIDISSNNLAYVIYTSGSTGNPKGVAISHSNVISYIAHVSKEYLDNVDGSVVSLPLAFDATVTSLLAPLCRGLYVELLPSGDGLFDALRDYLFDDEDKLLFKVTPAHLEALSAGDIDSWKSFASHIVVVGGEQLLTKTITHWKKHHLPNSVFINEYGPTEATVGCVTFTVDSLESLNAVRSVVPIGQPIANSKIYNLDAQRRLLPIGLSGELYIGGAGVARGYINREELTAERFIRNPFNASETDLLYKTGDLVRWLPDGNMEFLGRIDNQIKIRGYRIELGEIESALLTITSIKEAVVSVFGNHEKESALVAYLVLKDAREQALTADKRVTLTDAYQAILNEVLPQYMIPRTYVFIDEVPLTHNGKVDRKRLLPPGDDRLALNKYSAPESILEKKLCDLWKDVLAVENIGITDNFFALGGDSIISIQLVSRAKKNGLHFTVRQLFESQTIEHLAPLVKDSSIIHAEQGMMVGQLPLLPIHKAFFEERLIKENHYNQSVLLETPDAFNMKMLQEIIKSILCRHDALRIRFNMQDGQRTANYVEYSDELLLDIVACHDLSEHEEDSISRMIEFCREVQTSLDITQGLLLKVLYFKLADNTGRLFITIHHLVIDNVSWRILFADLEAAWQQLEIGLPVQLAEKTSSLLEWGRALKELGESDKFKEEINYWREMLSIPLCGIPRNDSKDNLYSYEFALTSEHTRQLLGPCSEPYSTQINELLLAALLISYTKWSCGKTMCINMEGHGREELFEHLDVTETVGWFTSVFPVILTSNNITDIKEIIINVKEQYRKLKNNGIGYGILKYLLNDQELRDLEIAQCQPNIEFNYLGVQDDIAKPEHGFSRAAELVGNDVSAENQTKVSVSINGGVRDGRLRFSMIGDGKIQSLDIFGKNFESALLEIVQHCTTADRVYTPSDFPASLLNLAELGSIQSSYDSIEKIYIATPMQIGLLFHGQLDGSGSSYTTQVSCDIQGDVSALHLERAWQYVLNRHDILRTCFVGFDSARIHQLVKREVKLPFEVLDWQDIPQSEIDSYLSEFKSNDKLKGFNFAEPPLARVTLIAFEVGKFHIVWTYHHALLDGWCTSLIFEEVLAAYSAIHSGQSPQLPTPASYEQYIFWLANQTANKAELFWKEHIGSLSTPTIIAYETLSTHTKFKRVTVELSAKISEQLENLAKTQQATMNVILQLAWGYLLHRYTDESDIVFGETISGRPAELAGVEEMVGLFINTVPIRIGFEKGQNIGSILKRIHQENISREEFGYLSLSEINKLSNVPEDTSLFDTLFVYENFPISRSITENSKNSQSSFSIENVKTVEFTNFSLTLVASNSAQGLVCHFDWDIEKFSIENINKIASHFYKILKSLSEIVPIDTVESIEMLSKDEYQALDILNATDFPFPHNVCIHHLFEKQASNYPSKVALDFEGEIITYAELDRRANQLSHFIVENLPAQNSFVALYLERSIEMVIAMLGILKAGVAYVPIDPAHPDARVRYFLDDCGAKIVLTQVKFSDVKALSENGRNCFCMDSFSFGSHLDSFSSTIAAAPNQTANQVMYVIYTSGSTGEPKGVCMEHRGLVNRIDWMQKTYELDLEDKVLQKTPYGFDVSVWEFFWPLSVGAGLVIAKPDGHKEPDYLLELIKQKAITTLHFVPSMLEVMIQATDLRDCVSLKRVFCSGEELKLELTRLFFQSTHNVNLYNLYGPTEAAIDVSHWTCRSDQASGPIPIGAPINNIKLFNLDSFLRPVPIGIVGELYISGVGLAKCYLNKPELTMKSFISNPYGSNEQYSRLYKTGDLVRWNADGQLEFIGRKDSQVKVRGNRIELGEIENALISLSDVEGGVVTVLSESNEKRLIAYIVAKSDANVISVDEATLVEGYKSRLRLLLPEYMIPAHFILIDKIPLNSNGKVDRRSLPVLNNTNYQGRKYAEPRNSIERSLCRIWEKVLLIDGVGIYDEFLSLGGDSILSMRIVAQAKNEGLYFTVRQLYENPSIAMLAKLPNILKHISVPQHRVEGEQILTPIQVVFFEDKLIEVDHFNQSVLLETPVGFDILALEKIIRALISRHDALRLKFNISDIFSKAQYIPYSEKIINQSVKEYVITDNSGIAFNEQLHLLCNEAQAGLDIASGHLFKAILFRTPDSSQRRLLIVIHHLVVDGVSWRIISNDLESAWQQLRLGHEIELPPKTSSLQKWGSALASYSKSDRIEFERKYWLEQLSVKIPPLPGVCSDEMAIKTVSFQLDASETARLLAESGQAYNTQINELLIASFMRAYQRWSGACTLCLEMESHGREEVIKDIDNSDTVGWFTTIYPLVLAVENSESFKELILSIKNQYRKIPGNGISYGVLKFIRRDAEIIALDEHQNRPRIEFNYLGQLDGAFSRRSDFPTAAESPGNEVSSKNKTKIDISIVGAVREGCLGFRISCNVNCRDITELATYFKGSLVQCIEHCAITVDGHKVHFGASEKDKHLSIDELIMSGFSVVEE